MFHGQAKVSTTFSVIVSIVSASVIATVAWMNLRADVNAGERTNVVQSRQLEGLETRTRTLEEAQADIRVMKNDVDWIRRALEQQQRRSP